MYAVIETGSKQFKVQPGDVIYVEKLAAEVGEEVSFDALMLQKEDGIVVGTPVVEGVKVTGKVAAHGKGAKVIIFKFKAKKNYRKKQGHRQPFTKVEIVSIG